MNFPLLLALILAPAGVTAGERQSSAASSPKLPTAQIGTPVLAPLTLDLHRLDASSSLGLTASAGLPPLQLPPAVIRGYGATDWIAPSGSAPETGQTEDAASLQAGRALFDHAASNVGPSLSDRIPSVSSWLRRHFTQQDIVPSWPVRPGDKTRVGWRTWTVGDRLGEGSTSVVHLVRESWDVAVKIIHPEFASDPLNDREVEALEGLARTDIPHARLLARSADNRVLVKERINGRTAASWLESGDLRGNMVWGLAELSARLIRVGYSADLPASNLVWEPYRQAWHLVDAGGFAPAGPKAVLRQVWSLVERSGADPAAFLSALRPRLGPESAAWKELERDGGAPWGRAMAKLLESDRAGTAPSLSFEAAPPHPLLDDRIVSRKEMARRLGFDPLDVGERYRLHGDDPGKLNTEVWLLKPAQGRPHVLKFADRDIVRAELAARRLLRRFFGGYLKTPGALGGRAGLGTWFLVMEQVEGGSPSFYQDPLDPAERVALGLAAQTFGFYDVNPGNVLRTGRDAWVIDFEQALSRREPNTGRLPIWGILLEMPWMSRRGLNRIEDFLPAAARWRRVFLAPEAQADALRLLRESGYSAREAAALQERFRRNVEDLEWSLQTDVEFANYMIETRSR